MATSTFDDTYTGTRGQREEIRRQTLRHQDCGFRNDDFLRLKPYRLHESKRISVGGVIRMRLQRMPGQFRVVVGGCPQIVRRCP